MKNFYIIMILKFIMIIIPVLMSVAYLTLCESKMMGYTQLSKGPNVVGMYGILQPLADGLKLFSKEIMIPSHMNMTIYMLAPILALTMGLVMWSMIPLNYLSPISDLELGVFFMLALSSMNIYSILMSGWGSNSKYAFLGALSAVAQMMSYEICIGLLIMGVMFMSGGLNLSYINFSQNQSTWFIFPLLPSGLMFFMSCLAETNSAPFDLTEGESELVSGYNVEYSSMIFAAFFLAEYAHIMFMSFFFCLLFLGGLNKMALGSIIYILKSSFIIMLFVWMSTSFPSLSYDQLMYLLWKTYLPLSIGIMFFYHSIIWSFGGLPPLLS